MTSIARSRRFAQVAMPLLAALAAVPTGAQVAPYKIAEATVKIVGFWAEAKNPEPIVHRNTPYDLRLVVRYPQDVLSLSQIRRELEVESFHVQAELTGPGLSRPLKLPRASDPPAEDPLVLRLPALTRPGEYTLSRLFLATGREKLLAVVPDPLTVKVVEEADPAALSAEDGEDTMPPGAVNDLAGRSPAPGVVRLTWTAPDDDGPLGAAARYELRYSLTPINAYTFHGAIRASAPKPEPSGATQAGVLRLRTPATYYFALRTADSAYNWSVLSNVVSVTVR